MNAPAAARPAGQGMALGMSTTAFTVCFAVWTIFSIIGIQIRQELGLTQTEFGLLVGTPILTGSLIRVVLGIWTDQYGGRRVFTVTMLAAAIAMMPRPTATRAPGAWARRRNRETPSATAVTEGSVPSPKPAITIVPRNASPVSMA